MLMMKRYATVDEYIIAQEKWQAELVQLRSIIQKTELVETVKWGMPTYTINKKNVIGLGAFKEFFTLWFHQGAFLKDNANKLINAQEGKTKGMRQWRFSSIEEIDESVILAYLEEAIQNQKDGKEIKPARKKELVVPQELEEAFAKDRNLKEAFTKLSLSCKREYAEYIQEAKKEATKQRRLDKIVPMILEQKGLHDKYKR